MFVLFKSLARNLILPPAGPLILAIIGLALMPRRRKLGGALVITAVAALWLCATPVVADVLTRMAERYPSLDPSKPVSAQAVVILGGGSVHSAPEYAGSVAEGDTLYRLVYGAFVARRTSLPILVTGSREEAAAMSATLSRSLGVNARWIENQSGDTFENARFSARLLRAAGIQRIVVVTSANHEWRAAHEFMAAGFVVIPAPVGGDAPRAARGVFGFIPGPGGLERSYSAIYELLGEPARELMAALHLRRQQADWSRSTGAAAAVTSPAGSGAVPSGD
jgi:uncharacterized SAM-binding protein YcdF (DUF218 family)